jgi:uncharacterized protein YecT (DUF1311 family)
MVPRERPRRDGARDSAKEPPRSARWASTRGCCSPRALDGPQHAWQRPRLGRCLDAQPVPGMRWQLVVPDRTRRRDRALQARRIRARTGEP